MINYKSALRIIAITAILLNRGLREGELMALLSRNIDWENGCIHVTNAMTRVNGSPHLGPTKTPESVRTIPVVPDIMELIKARIRGETIICSPIGKRG